MAKPVRVLIVDDNEADAELVLRELRRGGYAPPLERVETVVALQAALGRPDWDIVLSDWHMPKLDAPTALAIVKELTPDLPFIIISGTVGEDIAIEAMRSGAHDFIPKDKL